MSHETRAFDAGPDPELGPALRAALEPGDPGAFVAHVLARLGAARPRAWDVLAGWAGRGIAAAALAALVAGMVVGRLLPRAGAADAMDDVLAASAPTDGPLAARALLVDEGPPDPAALFASLVEP